ncbi:MAG: VanZ family protein [Candidatus Electrothrix sp. Rat3]|nr:VanZ family protein [Candidatus Electrothrix rattekaaiensis]
MSSFLRLIRKYWRACTITLLVAITVLSLWPDDPLSSAPGNDKLHHFVAYAALVFPVALRRPKSWLLIIVLFIFLSGLIELIQPFVNRYGEWLDLAANTTGLFCGVLIAEGLRRWEMVKGGEVAAKK